MSESSDSSGAMDTSDLTNGSGAAALLAAGIGAFLVAALAIVADQVPGVKHFMNFYKPTGPLSGVTTTAIILWLVVWAVLDARWKRRNVGLKRVCLIALLLLAAGVLLTFPPIGDLF